MIGNIQPEALRIADEFKLCSEYDSKPSIIDIEKAEAELRRLHAENVTLQQGYDAARLEIDSLQARVQELGAMLRENRSKRIVELEAQLEAIGAGGIEPLRRRECLHQIAEPAQPDSITDQEIDRIAESMPGGLDGFLKGLGWRQFARAVLEHSTRKAAPAAVAVPSERWRERWHGSPTEQGWSIMHGRECIAYLGPDVSPEAVSAIVAAHNAAPTTQEAPPQEAQEPVAWRIDSQVVRGRYITFDEHPGLTYPNAQPLYTAPQPAPVAQADALDAAFDAVRQRLCGLQRYSFVLDDDDIVRRVQDRTGNWIEFDAAHELFDPVAVDAARSQAKEVA